MRPHLVLAGAVATLLLAAALWLFQPWRLFTSNTVDEPEPIAAAPATATPTTRPTPPDGTPSSDTRSSEPASSSSPSSRRSGSPSTRPSPTATRPSTPERRDRVLARGKFEDAEHATSGRVLIKELVDGRRVLRLVDLDTSDGPDLHVWITDRPRGGSWGSYDDGRYVRLGPLKANRGNQNYEIPADAKLAGLTSVVIWCDRFDVAFGTAPVDL